MFHKSFDLVNSLTNRFNLFSNETKILNRVDFNKTFQLGKKFVGEGRKTFIVAEAGLNHNGSLAIAKKLIDEAKKAKCDAIKFQSFLPDSRVSKKLNLKNTLKKL